MAKEKHEAEKVKLPLSKPVTAHGDTLTVLELRAPTGEDLLEVGAPPFLVDKRERTHIDLVVTGEYIVRLASVPLSTVKQMAPIDMFAAFGIIAGFFGASETTRKNSSEDTTS